MYYCNSEEAVTGKGIEAETKGRFRLGWTSMSMFKGVFELFSRWGSIGTL